MPRAMSSTIFRLSRRSHSRGRFQSCLHERSRSRDSVVSVEHERTVQTLAVSRPTGIDEQAWSVLTPDVRRTRVSAGQRVRASDVEPSLTFFPISLLLSFVSPQSGVEILSLGAGGTSVPDLLLGSDALGLDAVVTVEGEAWSIPTSILRQLAAEHPPVEKAMRAQGGLALREAVRHAEERTRSLQISTSRAGSAVRWR